MNDLSGSSALPEPDFIEVGEGGAKRRIAVRKRAGSLPGVFWLGGFNSDMKGTKAQALDDWAVELVTGATIFLPRGFMLNIAVAEDIVVNTTPDVVFHFSLKRSL